LVVLISSAMLWGCGPPVRTPSAPGAEAAPAVQYERARWSQLEGWGADDLREAWPAFLKTCNAIASRAEWVSVCAAARALSSDASSDVRAFFERNFDPYSVMRELGSRREDTGVVTGYFEPLLKGARTPSGQFNTPLYAPPPDLLTVDLASLFPELKGKRVRGRLQGNKVVPYYSRAELPGDPVIRGNEIVWIDNALDAFLFQIQGSGRVQLPSGETIRLQYADQNGYPYRSIGAYLVEHGDLTVEQATMPGIRQWFAAHPERVQEVLNANPSVVFFREEPIKDPTQGPRGALGIPLTPGRSIAIDPALLPLGAPVFLATTFPASEVPLRRLMVAQDTGGAIRGAPRADFFWGVGAEAAEQAGKMRQSGRMWLLWPKTVALPAH